MCGIAGIINKTPRTFDYSAFCTLGIANDSRGGDSCGVFIDGKYEYGVDSRKYFQNYFPDSDLLYDTKKSSVALLHCRKASVGNISEATAQPVVITDDLGKVEYVLLHNGTIHNYKSLAEKYIPNVDITGMTDSQVMARIFYYKGYDCLDEYNGGAVFAIVDYRGYAPEVLLYKGASKKTKYSKDAEEERPLYYCIDKSKRELIFSSIGIYLLALRKELTAYSMKPNVLNRFTGTALVPVKEYPRENCFQNKEIVYNTNPVYGGAIKGNLFRKAWEGYDDDDDDYSFTYISYNFVSNTYTYKGEALHGRNFLTSYGRIENKGTKDNMEIWFYKGVALKNAYCFRFLSALKKETHLSDEEFCKKFETTIRFLSLDGLFSSGTIWRKAISPTESIPFTGVFQPIGAISRTEYSNGVKGMCTYNGSYTYVKELLSTISKHDINLKKVKEECKSLMK